MYFFQKNQDLLKLANAITEKNVIQANVTNLPIYI